MSSRAFTNEQAKTLDPRLKMSRMTEGGLCYDNGFSGIPFSSLGVQAVRLHEELCSKIRKPDIHCRFNFHFCSAFVGCVTKSQ